MRFDTTPAVDAISKLNLYGPIFPLTWFHKIQTEAGKPDFPAILILAITCHYYRWVEIIDETTDTIVGFRKKFQADKWQKSYDSFATESGLTPRQVEDALSRLDNQYKLITRERRDVDIEGFGTIRNALFVEPIPEAIEAISFPITRNSGQERPKFREEEKPEILGESARNSGKGRPKFRGNTQIPDKKKRSRNSSNFFRAGAGELYDQKSPSGKAPKEPKQRKPKSPPADSPPGEEQSRVSPITDSQQTVLGAFARLRKLNMRFYRGGFGRLHNEFKLFLDDGVTVAQVIKFEKWWYGVDFRGRTGVPPTNAQIQELWATAQEWQEPGEFPIAESQAISRPAILNGNGFPLNKTVIPLNKAMVTQSIVHNTLQQMEAMLYDDQATEEDQRSTG